MQTHKAKEGCPTPRFGLWLTVGLALAYCVWLGNHWLRLDYSDKELAGLAAHAWEFKHEIFVNGILPWWTQFFMSGSSNALLHTHSFYLVPWLLFSTFCSLNVAGKLCGLLAISSSAVTMFICARYFLSRRLGRTPLVEWAAVLAGIVYLLHPQQLVRAATSEHLTISLSIPLIPLMWWRFARALETYRFSDAVWCALLFALSFWTDNKQLIIQGVFLTGYAIYWMWRQKAWVPSVRTGVVLGVLTFVFGAFAVVPALMERPHVKLFHGDPMEGWQRNYAFKSLLPVVDRDGGVTRAAIEATSQRLSTGGFQPRTEAEKNELERDIRRVFAMQADAPEKYTGLLLLAVLAVVVLFNRQRADRDFFWLCVVLLLVSVGLGTGLDNVWNSNQVTATALFGLPGIPSSVHWSVLLSLAAVVVFLFLFYKRKLTTPNKRIAAGVALAIFLFVPMFKLLALLPYFKEIRAPFVFYDLPAAFFAALLAGCLVTDVLDADRWRVHIPKIVGGLAVLLLLDFWPYQKPMKDNGVPARTLANLEAAYTEVGRDPDWVKTYSISGRYFHLLGPIWSGKPQVYEAFLNWMAPIGTGLLNQFGGVREMLNLFAARYIVFDKSDPGMQSPQMQQLLAQYRQTYPVAVENEDFAVLRNETAHPYVSATTRLCVFTGDVRQSPQIALQLAGKNYTLVHDVNPAQLPNVERTYTAGSQFFPPVTASAAMPLTDVKLTRENSQLIRIRLTAPSNCVVVVSESYYPYWRAEVAGQPTEVWRVNCALMGIAVPAGTHDIVLRYQPPTAYAVCGMLSILSVLGCVVVATIRRSGATPPAK